MGEQPHPDSAAIDALGGSGRTAAICGVSSQAVSHWRRAGIPQARRMYLKLLRPDVFAPAAVAQPERAAEHAEN